jgi:large subunit ribosomal protein L13e
MHHIKPVITKQNGKQRPGKGFSPDEIKEAGLDAGSARKLGVPVDRKRRTSHEANIEALKAHMEKAPAAKPKAEAAESKKKPKT